jgi:hypothetical protein
MATKLLIPAGPIVPSPLFQVLHLARLEEPRWEQMLASIDGLLAASYISDHGVEKLLTSGEGWPNAGEVRLFIGNPGPEGTENRAEEESHPSFEWSAVSARSRHNNGAVEWSEVIAKETYTYFGVWLAGGGPFLGYAELTTPVEAEKGDTVCFNKEALVLEIP